MLSESDLRGLLDFSTSEPVVSLYLATDPQDGNADTVRLRLRNMLKEVNLPQDERAIEHFFDLERDWSGRSLAIFSCAPKDFFRAYQLAVPTTNQIRVDNRPVIKPLVDMMDIYGGYGVALVDKQGARLFHIHMGELTEQEGVMGEAVKHVKRGGASSMPGRRGGVAGRTQHEEEVVERNMREVVDFAVHFFEQKRVRRILIGGTDDNIALFRSSLPKAWQSLVVGTFPMSMTATNTEVLERAMQMGTEAKQRREKRMVETIITAAAKGSGGVLGLDDTLQAIHDGRVQTLLINDGFREPGFRCTGCGYLTTQDLATCPYCGKSFEKILDAVELAIQAVMQTTGDVVVIHDGPALAEAGKIGALLRY